LAGLHYITTALRIFYTSQFSLRPRSKHFTILSSVSLGYGFVSLPYWYPVFRHSVMFSPSRQCPVNKKHALCSSI